LPDFLAHRRHLRERYGDFDESMLRCVDWELIVRYTADSEPVRVSVVTNRYRQGSWPRVTTVESASLALYQLARKSAALPTSSARPNLTRASTPLKVLYALELFPALSES
jgi:hypothetical protein